MKHGRDLDDVAPQAVHDSIAAVDDLAEGLVTNLAYYPSGQRVRFESPHRRDDSFHDEVGVVRGVSRHIGADRLDVLDRLGCSDDLGHRRSRRFASV